MRRGRETIGRIATLAVVLALALAGCGGDDDGGGGGGAAEGPVTVTVGTLPIANAAPMYLGMKKGFFDAERVKIKTQVGEGGAALIPALLSGDTQFAFVGVIPAITAVAKDLPMKIVTSSDDAAATEDKDWQTLVVATRSSCSRCRSPRCRRRSRPIASTRRCSPSRS